ncbi:MAG: hypothetical protein GTO71_12750 [Woeseiaceae bacterium]|nr:hypothetical protein [Woeseiaceae bacterium]NIP21936.1 hypothetical protein [Woeseiaceae bacterium]NIS91021.1 hypothetical protein [Woeseiaceae bacterium]
MHRPSTIAFIVLTALACLALVYFLRIGWMQAAASAKFFASAGFLATAISAGALRHRFGRIVFAGLLLSMSGDMFLIGPSRQHFVFGLFSFLLAHVAYITAFVTAGQDPKWAGFAAIPVVAVAVIVLVWLQPHVPENLAMPVDAYVIVISLMVITAFSARGAGASGLIVAGALMFFVSDLSVAMQRIIETDFPTFVWGLPLYYAAQLCFALAASHSSSQ